MKKRYRIKKKAVALLLVVVVGLGWFTYSIFSKSSNIVKKNAVQIDISKNTKTGYKPVHTENAVLMSLKDGTVLNDYKGNQMAYPASITKLMTLLVVLDYYPDLDKKLTVTYEDLEGLYEANSSMMGLAIGEEISVRDLIYGSLLPSGNDAIHVLANNIPEDDVVALMNKKAEELGMKNTHYINTTGLHIDGHYSTAYDSALLMREVTKNDAIFGTMQKTNYITAATNKHPEGIEMRSTVFMRVDKTAEMIGGKTGFTEASGQCVVMVLEFQGERYISVIMNAEGDSTTQPYHIIDAVAQLDILKNSVE